MSFHLRPPSIDKGVSAFLWAFGFFLYLWLGAMAIGVDGMTSFILSAVAGGAIFLFIRVYGEDRPRSAYTAPSGSGSGTRRVIPPGE
jgi:hypothetical protein